LGILLFGLAGGIWVLLPFIDNGVRRFGRRIVVGAGVFAVCYIVALTIHGYVAK
jgi:hypothetical protein